MSTITPPDSPKEKSSNTSTTLLNTATTAVAEPVLSGGPITAGPPYTGVVPAPPPASTLAEATPSSAPTVSHALAVSEHDEIDEGAVIQAKPVTAATDVKDLGWNVEGVEDVPAPLVGGLSNGQLWTLLRRFNKQMYHVKAMSTEEDAPGGLDLAISEEEEFSPDKLRANVERLYMTVGVGMAAAGKHVARLRSWKEKRRTAAFAGTYFVAWMIDMLFPLLFGTLITLIVYPEARTYLFPPAPLALVDAKTGGIKKPGAGVLGSNSLTGAPEAHQGEAVEQEAHNVVASFSAIAMNALAGKHPDGSKEMGKGTEIAIPDPTDIAHELVDTRDTANTGNKNDTTRDKTKKPVEEAMWEKARPVMHVIGEVSDGWERFGNALSATPPFEIEKPRMRLAAVVGPALMLSFVTHAYVFVKASSLITGLVFFGDPVLSRLIPFLNGNFPGWQRLLELRNTILQGVPTNAQLTITLLRVGEARKAPLPPPPKSTSETPDRPAQIDHAATAENLDADPDEVALAAQPYAEPTTGGTSSESTVSTTGSDDTNKHSSTKSKGRKLLSLFKGTTRAGVSTALETDKLKAAAGAEHAKNRLGVVPPSSTDAEAHSSPGPVEFAGRYRGKKGFMYILTSAASPCVVFAEKRRSSNGGGSGGSGEGLDVEPLWTVPVGDITELRKIGGLGWKSKLVVGWSLDREVRDGIEIVDKSGGSHTVTALKLREELFNRLVSMGSQKWECW